ncbi:MAG: hypothetical protein ACRDVP_04985 [Acidimicrobiales bacterium]
MSLETYSAANDLHLARGPDVNVNRPLFTGDVVANVSIPGVQDRGMAIVIAHPCSIRGPHAQLTTTVLAAAVREHDTIGPEAWTKGYFGLTPLPDVAGAGMHVGHLDGIGRAPTEDVVQSNRVACLSVLGVNLLQQRLIWHLTRLEVPTFRLQEAFVHTYEEADLLEEWIDTRAEAGVDDATAKFEEFIRAPRDTGRNLQDDSRDPQRRSAVRGAFRAEARRIVDQQHNERSGRSLSVARFKPRRPLSRRPVRLSQCTNHDAWREQDIVALSDPERTGRTTTIDMLLGSKKPARAWS